MFVGYAANDAGDAFKMLNLETKRIWQCQDVWWITPSLLAYTALQLAQMKARKNYEHDFDDKPKNAKATATTTPNWSPAKPNAKMMLFLPMMLMKKRPKRTKMKAPQQNLISRQFVQ